MRRTSLETAPGGMPWDAAMEVEPAPQMWSLRRKHGPASTSA
ncbi:hypothetical protein [Nostocoides australiense]